MNESEFREKYYPLAKKQTLETLPKFLNELFSESLDYGSVCCEVAASALAAAWAANNQPKGGITGFQAGAVMWEFIRAWNFEGNKCGLRLVDYDNMLYSQYEHYFQKTISKDVFEHLQKEAQRLLDKDRASYEEYIKDSEQYNKDMIAFVKKYPDFTERPEYYEHLSGGTCDQWDAYYKKRDSGFEFAPREPHYFRGLIEHWQSIVNGVVPFGYTIKED